MRGKLQFCLLHSRETRITPADAGKTVRSITARDVHQDHPRGCGENGTHNGLARLKAGSPPRMRGKLDKILYIFRGKRITPADAGKTIYRNGVFSLLQDHPRGCGEN